MDHPNIKPSVLQQRGANNYGAATCFVYFAHHKIPAWAVFHKGKDPSEFDKWISTTDDCIAWLGRRGLNEVESQRLLLKAFNAEREKEAVET